jgi:DNA processing protein
LYVKGTLLPIPSRSIAVVGTRNASTYGKKITAYLVEELVRSGFTIISGLALGIDSIAHETALQSGGKTVAVLGSAVNEVYPRSNLKLSQQILQNGALVSEFPLGTLPTPFNFPQRNRIISALSMGTVVVEAGEKSGALITATFALEQNREVFAVPGPLFAQKSIGTNHLIQQGAKLVTSVDDILEELNLPVLEQKIEAQKQLPSNRAEKVILELLQNEPLHIDAIGRELKQKISEVSVVLTMMEMKGLVQSLGGGRYSICYKK